MTQTGSPDPRNTTVYALAPGASLGQRQRTRQRGFADVRRTADQISVRGSIIRDGAIETQDGPRVADHRPLGGGHAAIITMNAGK